MLRPLVLLVLFLLVVVCTEDSDGSVGQQLQEYAQTALGSQTEPTFNQPFQLSTPLQARPPFSLVHTSLLQKFAGQCHQDSSSKIYFTSPGSEKPFFQYACHRIVANVRPQGLCSMVKKVQEKGAGDNGRFMHTCSFVSNYIFLVFSIFNIMFYRSVSRRQSARFEHDEPKLAEDMFHTNEIDDKMQVCLVK
ncbi:hypothetical protein Hanom_Chr05g00396141 [Helianthus anomalus]